MYRKLKNAELQRLTASEFKKAAKIPVIVVLEDVRSAYNVGAVFRTADAFLIESVYLCGFTPVPPHREIQKTALGANETVDWKYYPSADSAIAVLKDAGYKIVAVEQVEDSILLQDFSVKKEEKLAIIFGNEVGGVSQTVIDNADACIEIPQYGTKHSLNIAVCTGIVLWELLRKGYR